MAWYNDSQIILGESTDRAIKTSKRWRSKRLLKLKDYVPLGIPILNKRICLKAQGSSISKLGNHADNRIIGKRSPMCQNWKIALHTGVLYQIDSFDNDDLHKDF